MRDYVQNTYFDQMATALAGQLYASQTSQNVVSALWYDESNAEVMRPGMAVLLIPSASTAVPATLSDFARAGIDFVAVPAPVYAATNQHTQLGIVVRSQAGGGLRYEGGNVDTGIQNGVVISVLRIEASAQIYMLGDAGSYTAGETTAYIGATGDDTMGRIVLTDPGDGYPVKVEILDAVTIDINNRNFEPIPVRFLGLVGA